MTDPEKKTPRYVCGLTIESQLGEGANNNAYLLKDNRVLITAHDSKLYQSYGVSNITSLDIMTRLHHPNLMAAEALVTSFDAICPTGLGIIVPRADTDLYNIEILNLNAEEKIDICYKTINALIFLHQSGYFHFDVTPGNILLKKVNINGKVTYEPLLSDFDFATPIDGSKSLFNLGTPDFKAPEMEGVVKSTKGDKSDVWSLGMTIFYIFAQKAFDSQDNPKVSQYSSYKDEKSVRTIIEESLDKDIPSNILSQLTDLLQKMLILYSEKRITMSEVLGHSLFTGKTPIAGVICAQPIESHLPGPIGSIQRIYEDFIKFFQSDSNSIIFEIMNTSIIFLAVDLIYRSFSLIKDSEERKEILAHNIACQLIAWKYYKTSIGWKSDHPGGDLAIRLAKLRILQVADVLRMEIKIIVHLKGMIYRPYIWETCRSSGDVSNAIKRIIPYPEIYYKIDLQKVSGYSSMFDKYSVSLRDLLKYSDETLTTIWSF